MIEKKSDRLLPKRFLALSAKADSPAPGSRTILAARPLACVRNTLKRVTADDAKVCTGKPRYLKCWLSTLVNGRE